MPPKPPKAAAPAEEKKPAPEVVNAPPAATTAPGATVAVTETAATDGAGGVVTDPASSDVPPATPGATSPGEPPPTDPEAAAETPAAPAMADLLTRPHVRAFFKKHADEANKVLRTGPGGGGWRHNETKRQEAEEFAAVLNYLSNGLEESAIGKDED